MKVARRSEKRGYRRRRSMVCRVRWPSSVDPAVPIVVVVVVAGDHFRSVCTLSLRAALSAPAKVEPRFGLISWQTHTLPLGVFHWCTGAAPSAPRCSCPPCTNRISFERQVAAHRKLISVSWLQYCSRCRRRTVRISRSRDSGDKTRTSSCHGPTIHSFYNVRCSSSSEKEVRLVFNICVGSAQ
jgi:hypothetical protein